MGQLVAVQHKRGASGGLVFAKALGLCLDLGEPAWGADTARSSLPALIIPPRSTAIIPPSQVDVFCVKEVNLFFYLEWFRFIAVVVFSTLKL
jgi:hypothetical protein